MRTNNLSAFLPILFDKHHVSPRRSTEVAGVVVRVSRPNEAVIRHLVPFLARDLAGFAADANGWIGEEANLDVVAHVRVPALIRAVCAFANHASGVVLILFLRWRDHRRRVSSLGTAVLPDEEPASLFAGRTY